MGNRYYEVLRTYWRRTFSSWALVVCIVPQLILAVAIFFFPRPLRTEHLMPITMVIGFIGAPLWVHFREQIVAERRKLVPAFLTPHLVIFISALVLLTIVWPGAIILTTGAHSIGLMAFAAALAAFIGLWVLGPKPYLVLPGVIGWMWIMTGKGLVYILPFVQGNLDPLALALLGISLVAIVWTIFRMTRLTEEDAAYYQVLRYNTFNSRPRATGETNQIWVDAQRSHQVLGWPRPGRKPYIPATNSIWAGAQRWRRVTSDSFWFFALLSVAIIGGIELMARQNGSDSFPLVFMWLIFMPAAMVVPSWMNRWRFLETELLRPIDRPSFLKQIGLAIAIDAFRAWGVIALVLVGDRLILANHAVDWKLFIGALAASLAVQVMGFGASLWVMRYRSSGGVLLVAMLLIPGIFILITLADRSMIAFRLYAVAAAILLGALGVFLLYDAYKRWLVTDLG